MTWTRHDTHDEMGAHHDTHDEMGAHHGTRDEMGAHHDSLAKRTAGEAAGV